MKIIFGWLLALSTGASAQVYSPDAKEVAFNLKAYFYSQEPRRESVWVDEANRQISHTFGVFQSPEVIRKYDLNPYQYGGIGAVQFPVSYQILGREKQPDGTVKVSYSASGKMLLQNQVADSALRGSEFSVPLPVRLDDFYEEDCTDAHYSSFGDFWYFFDPFRSGCESLGKPPRADWFTFEVRPGTRRKLDMDLRLDLVRGDNGNGETFRIDVIHGFSDSSTAEDDSGRENFLRFEGYLLKRGYKKQEVQRYFNRPLNRYTKAVRLKGGKSIQVEINSLLVESSIDARTVTFAKFFRQSVKDADVIFYAGHSGLGGNLDISLLEEKSGGFKFNPNKRQIFIFDSCSSYSYYLYPFRAEKTRARIDIVTMGLSSLFDKGLAVLGTFVDEFTDGGVDDKDWRDVLQAVDDRMDGIKYLINVGGI